MHLPAEVYGNPHLSELIFLTDQANHIFMRHKSSLKASEHVWFSASSDFKGAEWLVLQCDPLLWELLASMGRATVDWRLITRGGLFSPSHGNMWHFKETVPWSRLLAQCYGGELWGMLSLFDFMGSVHSKTAQESKRVYVLKEKSMRVKHAKHMLCVQLLHYLLIASTNSKAYLTAPKALMPVHSSKIKQPFDF